MEQYECKRCRFAGPTNTGNPQLRTCRRYPPVPCGEEGTSYWPTVDAEGPMSGCFEWEPKKQ